MTTTNETLRNKALAQVSDFPDSELEHLARKDTLSSSTGANTIGYGTSTVAQTLTALDSSVDGIEATLAPLPNKVTAIESIIDNLAASQITSAEVTELIEAAIPVIDKNTLGLSNVDNTSDINKPVSTAQQAALDLKLNTSAFTKTGIGLGNVDNTSDANKPVSAATQAALDLKASTLALNTALSTKADTSTVNTALATKAALAGSSTQDFATKNLQVYSLNSGPLAGLRNALINGDFRIAQRGNSFTGGYGIDRWIVNSASALLTVTQYGPASNFANGFIEPGSVVMNLAGVAGNTAHNIQQRIESANSRHFAGKNVTLSFWVYNGTSTSRNTTVSMQYANSLDNFGAITNVGTSAALSCPAGQWTYHTATFSVPTAAINGLQITIGDNFGSIVAGQSVAYGNVQLELGDRATPFERRPYGLELMLCQRYYERARIHIAGNAFAASCCLSARWEYATQKRVAPVVQITPVSASSSAGTVSLNNGTINGVTAYLYSNAASTLVESVIEAEATSEL